MRYDIIQGGLLEVTKEDLEKCEKWYEPNKRCSVCTLQYCVKAIKVLEVKEGKENE